MSFDWDSPKKTILFVCTGNAGRSQIALALFRRIAGSDIAVLSAGVDPWPDLHPVARRLLGEKGLDASGLCPKHVHAFADTPLDFLVTIGDRARNETPRLGGNPVRLHWDIPDPADADGTGREEAVFRETLARIETRLPDLLAVVTQGASPADLHLAPGISTCVVRPNRFDPATHLPAIADAGFECIELNCYLGSRDFAWDEPKQIEELRRVADDTGVRVYSVHAAGGIGGLGTGHPDEMSLDLCRAYTDLAACLGAVIVMMHAGLPADAEREQASDWLRRVLGELAAHISGMPCRYAWENRAPGLSPEEHLAWIRDLDPGAFSFALDTGHANLNGTSRAYLEGCRGLLCDLHLNDNEGDRDAHQLPGAGTVEWAGFMGALKRCEYVGPLMLEVVAPDGDVDLASALKSARASIDYVRGLGPGISETGGRWVVPSDTKT